MAKKKKKFLDYEATQLIAAPAHIFAVYNDPEDDDDWCVYPVIAFTVGVATVVENGEPIDRHTGVVRGMISNHGGLELVEGAEDLEFIGYWRKDAQPEIAEFLSDHGIEPTPDGEDDEDDEDEDEDEDDA